MLVATKGIVLHRVKYSDRSLIVKVFTEKYGTRSFIIKNAFSRQSKIKYTHFTPLSLIEVHYDNLKPGQLQYLRELTPYYSFKNLPFDIVKGTILIFYNEILYKLLFTYGEDQRLYRFIENSIISLDATEEPLGDIHLKFLIKLIHIMGFSPVNNYSDRNSYFSISDSSFVAHYKEDVNFLTANTALYLHALLNALESGETVRFPGKPTRDELLYGLVRYVELHIAEGKQIESIEILAQVLN